MLKTTIFILALVVHGIFFWRLIGSGAIDVAMTDGEQYQRLADNLLYGRGFTLRESEPYVPDTIRTPIYPLTLAASKALFGSFRASTYLLFLFGLTIPLVGMLIGRLLGASKKVETAIGVLLALDPHLFYYSLIYGSESVFLPLAAWSVYLTCLAVIRRSWRVALAAGLLVGLTVLVRPIVQFLPVLFLVWILYEAYHQTKERRRLAKTAGVFLVAFGLTITPWLVRNYSVFGVWDYSNVGWFNMYTRFAATTEMMATGRRDYPEMRLEYLERLHEKGYVDHTPVEEWDVHGYEFKPVFQKETLLVVKQYPKAALVTVFSSASTVISQDLVALIGERLGLWDFRYPSFSPFVVLAQEGIIGLTKKIAGEMTLALAWSIIGRLLWLALFALSLLAPYAICRKDRKNLGLAIFLVLFELSIIALSINAAAQSDARYRAQFIFAEIPLAFLSLSFIAQAVKHKLDKSGASMVCPVCEARSFIVRRGRLKKRYDFFFCRLCHASFVAPPPTSEELTAFYSQNYFFGGGSAGGYVDYERDKQAARKSLEDFLDIVDARASQRGRWLDIGAATGVFLELARERGWQVFGHEVSEEAAKLARAKGLEVTVGDLPSVGLHREFFQAISLLDVIEHLPDPKAMVLRSHELLVQGGFLLINTPDSGSLYGRLMGRRWHAYNPPEHVVWFDRRTLTLLLERAGFEVVWFGRVPKKFRLSYILHIASQWIGIRLISRLASAVEKRGPNPLIPLDLRDNMVVLAKRL